MSHAAEQRPDEEPELDTAPPRALVAFIAVPLAAAVPVALGVSVSDDGRGELVALAVLLAVAGWIGLAAPREVSRGRGLGALALASAAYVPALIVGLSVGFPLPVAALVLGASVGATLAAGVPAVRRGRTVGRAAVACGGGLAAVCALTNAWPSAFVTGDAGRGCDAIRHGWWSSDGVPCTTTGLYDLLFWSAPAVGVALAWLVVRGRVTAAPRPADAPAPPPA